MRPPEAVTGVLLPRADPRQERVLGEPLSGGPPRRDGPSNDDLLGPPRATLQPSATRPRSRWAVPVGERVRGRPLVVLLCGVAGSGKTTSAQQLEPEGFVRLSVDEEVWARCGRHGIDDEPADYAPLSAVAEGLLRERLEALIRQGRDVVVDVSFWQRAGGTATSDSSRPTEGRGH